jgi:hypothetical protein
MKRTKLIAYLVNFYSMSAVAGYECVMQLSHQENLNKVVAEKVITLEKGQMKGGKFGALFNTLEVKGMMSSMKGQEEANFAIYRNNKNGQSIVGETIQIQGTSHGTSWFDSYKLGINCSLKS